MARTIIPKKEAYHPAGYTKADVLAIQAMAEGKATDGQQIRALKWIVEAAAATYDNPYRPNSDETQFACGKMSVGQQIVKLTKLNVSKLKEDEEQI